MKRILYKQIWNSQFRTKTPIIIGQLVVNVYINTIINTVIISDSKEVLYESTGKNYENLQRKARKALKKLGAFLETEIRKKPIC